MIFSQTCGYAIRALLCVAAPPTEGPITVREIARILDVPTTTLAKVVQGLVRHGLLVSHKGPGGGVMFGRSADAVTLLDVVETIDGPALRTQCILGVPGCCEPTQHCPLHSRWAKIREQILDVLGSRSLEELSEDLMGHDYALAGSVGRDGSAKGPRRHG